MRVLVVMPTYEEALNIEQVLRNVRASASDVDILVVDDNSPDGTAALARRVAAEVGQIDVRVRPRKEGLGSAYRDGFRIGLDLGYDVLMQMDADLSHDPHDVPRLLAALDAGCDLAIGSRYIPGGSVPHWAWYRRALSRYGNGYACGVLGMSIHDATSGFRAYRADAVKAIDVSTTRAKGYGFQIEMAYRVSRQSHAIDEIAITFTDRVRGRSKMSLGVVAEEMFLVTWWGIRDRLLPRLRRPIRR